MRTRLSLRVAVVALLGVAVGAACGDDGGGTLEVGDEAPAFTLPAADGTTVSLGEFDEPVLLYFHMADG
jgi:hypothetical protein